MEDDKGHSLKRYLHKGEGENIEFKQTISDEFKIAKMICSLANTTGGTILIGIRDDKSIAGIDPEEEKYLLMKAAGLHCRPPVKISIEELFIPDEDEDIKEKTILKVTIRASSEKPHYAEGKNGVWTPYLRQQDQTLIAGPQAINLMQRHEVVNSSELSKNEKRLIGYLEKNQKITLKEYTKLVNISQRRARRELLEALDKGIVRILEHESEDYYVL